jgi:hypothetical protein
MKTETIAHDLLCDSHLAERPRYFPRQLITADDMTLEQEYFRNKLRLHNRLLHGWGVVCGAQVCPVPKTTGNGGVEPWKVMVKEGYILGPYSDEIIIQKARIVDLRMQGVTSKSGDPSGELADPWCSPVYTGQVPPQVYIAVKYKEIMTRPVRVQPVGCGCEETPCEYSRLCDGYEIGLLPRCPDPDRQPPALDNFADLVKGPLHNCPPCPSSPWVVLAEVKLAEDGTITAIDNCICRRMVLSFAHVWWRCEGGTIEVRSATVTVAGRPATQVEQGQTDVLIDVSGANFRAEGDVMPKVSLGSGVTIGMVDVSAGGEALHISVSINPAASIGPRTLTIINPDCSMASTSNVMTIIPPITARPLSPPIEHPPEAPPTPPIPSPGEAARPRRRTRPR